MMKELMLIYIALSAVTISGCTQLKSVYPVARGDPEVGPTGGMILVQLTDGAEYVADGFKVEGDSLVLLPPIASNQSRFRSALDAFQQSASSPLEIQTKSGDRHIARNVRIDGDSLRFSVEWTERNERSDDTSTNKNKIWLVGQGTAVDEIETIRSGSGQKIEARLTEMTLSSDVVKSVQKKEANVPATVLAVALGSVLTLLLVGTIVCSTGDGCYPRAFE
jgi:hypothetical protein